jgi:hypothetical protein
LRLVFHCLDEVQAAPVKLESKQKQREDEEHLRSGDVGYRPKKFRDDPLIGRDSREWLSGKIGSAVDKHDAEGRERSIGVKPDHAIGCTHRLHEGAHFGKFPVFARAARLSLVADRASGDEDIAQNTIASNGRDKIILTPQMANAANEYN